MIDYVITQEDFDVNPLVTQLGLGVGDKISYVKGADQAAGDTTATGTATGEGETATGGDTAGGEVAGTGEGEAAA